MVPHSVRAHVKEDALVTTYLEAATIKPVRPLADHETQSHEGGIVSKSDNWTRLNRFLILGTQGGSFYVGERELSIENVGVVRACLDEDGSRTVGVIAAISTEGRAPKNEPALLALAMALRHPDVTTRRSAAAHFDDVVRTGTHLLHMAAYLKALGGGKKLTSRVIQRAFANWFLSKTPDALAYQAVKYQSRDGWALSDILRQVHPKTGDPGLNAVMKWIVDGWTWEGTPLDKLGEWAHVPPVIRAKELIPRTEGEGRVRAAVTSIRETNLPREALPSELLNAPEVWAALLDGMPMTAMVRNLGKMTSVGLIDMGSEAARIVADRLGDVDRLRKARVHPLALLVALKIYEQGHGEKGSLKWTPVKKVITALDEAFYLAFKTIEPTGKRIRLSVDVSGSMTGGQIAGMPGISPRIGAAAMALVTAATEPNAEIIGFATDLYELGIRPSMRLDEVLRTIERLHNGQGTYCTHPIVEATKSGKTFDAFVSYTDSQTMDGAYGRGGYNGSVADALTAYRLKTGVPARHVVTAMAANGISIADPNDALAMDIVGFDTATPAVIADFIAGRI